MNKVQLKFFSNMAQMCAQLAFYECTKYRETAYVSPHRPGIMELSEAEYVERRDDYKTILSIKGSEFNTFVDVEYFQG